MSIKYSREINIIHHDTSDNFITAYNDIKYTGLDGIVLSDNVEIDLTKVTFSRNVPPLLPRKP